MNALENVLNSLLRSLEKQQAALSIAQTSAIAEAVRHVVTWVFDDEIPTVFEGLTADLQALDGEVTFTRVNVLRILKIDPANALPGFGLRALDCLTKLPEPLPSGAEYYVIRCLIQTSVTG